MAIHINTVIHNKHVTITGGDSISRAWEMSPYSPMASVKVSTQWLTQYQSL